MACTLHSPTTGQHPLAVPPPMTRCECTGVSFEEIARCMQEERVALEDLSRRTGCAGNCTACLPDLLRFLASR